MDIVLGRGRVERLDLLMNCAGLLHEGELQPERLIRPTAKLQMVLQYYKHRNRRNVTYKISGYSVTWTSACPGY